MDRSPDRRHRTRRGRAIPPYAGARMSAVDAADVATPTIRVPLLAVDQGPGRRSDRVGRATSTSCCWWSGRCPGRPTWATSRRWRRRPATDGRRVMMVVPRADDVGADGLVRVVHHRRVGTHRLVGVDHRVPHAEVTALLAALLDAGRRPCDWPTAVGEAPPGGARVRARPSRRRAADAGGRCSTSSWPPARPTCGCGAAATPAATGSRPPPSPCRTDGRGPTPTPTCSRRCWPQRRRPGRARAPRSRAAWPSTRGPRWWSGRVFARDRMDVARPRRDRRRTPRWPTTGARPPVHAGVARPRRHHRPGHARRSRSTRILPVLVCGEPPEAATKESPEYALGRSTSRVRQASSRLAPGSLRRHGRVQDAGVPPRLRGVLRGDLRAPRGRRRGHPGPHRRPSHGVAARPCPR